MSMKRIKTLKAVWLTAATVSLVLGVLGLAGAVLFALRLLYVPLVISILLAAHAAYGVPYYFREYFDIRIVERLILSGASDVGGAAEMLNIDKGYCESLLSRMKINDLNQQ